MLAIGLLLAGMPFIAATMSHEHAAIYSLDICHPAQTISATSSHCSLAAPPHAVSLARDEILDAAGVTRPPLLTLVAGPPDTPPPKTFLQ
jgi:hypothetical protein